jgi:RNA polymerase sigma-70 factor (ECF subfamily)
MFRILRNLWIDSLRRRHTEGIVVDIADRLDLADPNGSGEAEARLALQKVRQAFPMLPSQQREVIALVCIEDMSYRAAADILDIPVGTVMSRLCRARRRLAELAGLDSDRQPARRAVA